MRPLHKYYLSLGSNLDPERNLAQAVEHLGAYGVIEKASGAWESHAVGSSGPDFLNACVLFVTTKSLTDLKQDVTAVVETKMGRVRTGDPSGPRTIDIDILMADDQPLNLERWSHPFVLLPMADLLPAFMHPAEQRPLADVANEARAEIWIVRSKTKFPPFKRGEGA